MATNVENHKWNWLKWLRMYYKIVHSPIAKYKVIDLCKTF